MKRLLLLLTVCCATLASCSETLDAEDKKDPTEEGEGGGTDNKEYTVKFKVDMRVPELQEGVINVKDDRVAFGVKLYTDLITSRLTIPNDYLLTFKKDGEIAGEYKGIWDETEIVLPNGEYTVTGQCDGDFNTASFSFDESVIIDKNTSILTLNPRFNCWLFAFDRQVLSNAWRCNGEKSDELIYLNKTEDVFYVFSSYSHPKLPFVLGDSETCKNFHEQIEYPEGNMWHLGLTWQDADKNNPAKVWYYPYRIYIGELYYCNKGGVIQSIDLKSITK